MVAAADVPWLNFSLLPMRLALVVVVVGGEGIILKQEASSSGRITGNYLLLPWHLPPGAKALKEARSFNKGQHRFLDGEVLTPSMLHCTTPWPLGPWLRLPGGGGKLNIWWPQLGWVGMGWRLRNPLSG